MNWTGTLFLSKRFIQDNTGKLMEDHVVFLCDWYVWKYRGQNCHHNIAHIIIYTYLLLFLKFTYFHIKNRMLTLRFSENIMNTCSW